jgi:hypothetical protein
MASKSRKTHTGGSSIVHRSLPPVSRTGRGRKDHTVFWFLSGIEGRKPPKLPGPVAFGVITPESPPGLTTGTPRLPARGRGDNTAPEATGRASGAGRGRRHFGRGPLARWPGGPARACPRVLGVTHAQSAEGMVRVGQRSGQSVRGAAADGGGDLRAARAVAVGLPGGRGGGSTGGYCSAITPPGPTGVAERLPHHQRICISRQRVRP